MGVDARDEAVVARLRLTMMQLLRLMRQESGNETTLTPSRFSALSTIDANNPLRMTDLAITERVSKSSITRIVGKLLTQAWSGAARSDGRTLHTCRRHAEGKRGSRNQFRAHGCFSSAAAHDILRGRKAHARSCGGLARTADERTSHAIEEGRTGCATLMSTRG